MLQSIWKGAFAESGNFVNLEDLRFQLAGHLALLLICVSGLTMLYFLPQDPFPIVLFSLLAALLVVGFQVRILAPRRPLLARYLLVWGLTTWLLAAMWLFPESWIPFLGLPLIFISAMLGLHGGFVTAGLIAVMAVWLTASQHRDFALGGLIVTLALSAASAWLATRTFDDALEWAWNMQQRADLLLGETRERRGEISRTYKSLDLAYALLQRTQHELIYARKQAEEAWRMKEQFAANISHELRTPLNLILGFSEVMYQSPEVYGELVWPPILRRDVYQIYRSSRHLMEMIDDILDLSRSEIVGFTLNKERTSLEALLQSTAEIAQDLFQNRPVRLEVEIASDLPTLEIDRTRIRQVLLNLLNNAQRFTEAGSVRLEAKRVEGEVVVKVRDTGPGIPADQLENIFDEFYQVDRSLHSRHEGMGLGLAISKRFVQAHDGRIWAESQAGQGSAFFFTLPIPGQSAPVSQLYVDHPIEQESPATRPSILVVETDSTVVAWIHRHLTEYDVKQVDNPARLDEEIQLHHPRAVVCNVPPGERRSPSISLSVPFIECSLPSQAWVANDLAVAACLTKPITAQRLLEEIDRQGNVHNVLVVDDDRGFGQLIERMLETSNRTFSVRHAYDGAEGLSAIRAQRPDLVLLDLIMPEIDGFQVLEEMRQEPEIANVPVVLLTATNYAEDVLKKHGSQVIIQRPGGLQPAEVLRCLSAAIGVLEPRYDERSTPEFLAAGEV